MFRAYGGDPTKVHFFVASGSEQAHVFNLGGHYWMFDPEIAQSQLVQNQGTAPGETFDAELQGGAGGLMRSVGDFFYGDLRRPFTRGRHVGPVPGHVAAELRRRPDQAARRPELHGAAVDHLRPAGAAAPRRAGRAASRVVSAGGARAADRDAGSPSPPSAAPAPRGLRVSGQVALRELATRGMRIELLVATDSRIVDLRLSRVSGKKLTVALNGRIKIRKGGADRAALEARPQGRRELRAGTYVLRVRSAPTPGTSRARASRRGSASPAPASRPGALVKRDGA